MRIIAIYKQDQGTSTVMTLAVSSLSRRDEQYSSFKGTKITIPFSMSEGKTEIIPTE